MYSHNTFFGYASRDDFLHSDICKSTENLLNFLDSLQASDSAVRDLTLAAYDIVCMLDVNDEVSFKKNEFMLKLICQETVNNKLRPYSNLRHELFDRYYDRAWDNYKQNPVRDSTNWLMWLRPQVILNAAPGINSNATLLHCVLDALKHMCRLVTEELGPEYMISDDELCAIGYINISALVDGSYSTAFSRNLTRIVNMILGRAECPDDDNIASWIRWHQITDKLNGKIYDIEIKHGVAPLQLLDIHYTIIAALNSPEANDVDKGVANVIVAVADVLKTVPTDTLIRLQSHSMLFFEIYAAIRDTIYFPNDLEYKILTAMRKYSDATKRMCNIALNDRNNNLTSDILEDIKLDNSETANESIVPVYTEAIEYLDRWSFDYISGDEIEVALESSDDDDDRDIRRKSREKRDELNEKRRKQSEKIRGTSAKIYKGYKTYKDNEEKVDSQLASLTKTIAQKATGLETDKIRDEIVEGKKFSPIGILKRVLGTVAIFSTSKIAGIISVVTHFYLKDKVTNSERKMVCQELEAEIEIVNEKIEDARADGNRKAKYELIRTKNNLETALKKIQARSTKTNRIAATDAKAHLKAGV